MNIESIRVKNYKVFKDMHAQGLPEMCVFLGPNGSGKSTLFDVFGFLSDCLQHNASIALQKRGGASEVWSRGASPDTEALHFEIKFRNPEAFSQENQNPLITYWLEIKASKSKAVIHREVLRYKKKGSGRGAPWHFLDFRQGKGYAISNESEFQNNSAEPVRQEQQLASPDILAIKGLGQFSQFRAISEFRRLLENWFISSFSIDAARKDNEIGIDSHLSMTGDNLAQITRYMYQEHRDIFDKILEKLPQRIPGISRVEAKDTEDGRVILRFQDSNFKDPFIGRFVSDGTIKMFAYMMLLYDPDPHPLLCIEEPENFLHPELLIELAEEIREYAERGGQVFVSTHSPDFVNAVQLDELFYLVKKNGYSTVHAVKDDEIPSTLYREGNKLGWLWRSRYIQGANLS